MKEKEKEKRRIAPSSAVVPLSPFHGLLGNSQLYQHHLPAQPHQQQYNMWHTKSFESGLGKTFY